MGCVYFGPHPIWETMVLESSGLSLLCMEAAQVERDNLCISIDRKNQFKEINQYVLTEY
jgi:hypothetical protein